jgi:CBS domain-containing protein
MRISEFMTPIVEIARPDQTIQQAARIMADADIGMLPVGDDDRLQGMVSDRDIATRAIAHGLGPDCPVSEVMTSDVRYCFEDEEAAQVAQNMGDQQIRRLPVVSRDKRLVGIVSLSDFYGAEFEGIVGETLASIARPGGRHNQKSDGAVL